MMQLPKGRPTFCSIDHEALRWNFQQVRKKVAAGVKILSVVKANAYGHGAYEVAKTLEEEGTDGFGVATAEEGLEIRKKGIQSPILVLGGLYLEQLDQLLYNNLTPVVSDLENLQRLDALASRRKIELNFHLKVDTGMNRIGLPASDADSWLPAIRKLRALKVEGLFSHFAHAESVGRDYTRKQLETFQSAIEQIRAAGYVPPLIHLANSAAVITLPSSHFTMVRPGIMLYGVYPFQEMTSQIPLRPVLSWHTGILQLKKVPKGSSISYGQTYTTRRASLIATLPVGYADGYPRLLSNRGAVLIRGKKAPVAGRVCMDLTMVDVTDIEGVQQGDEVILLGAQEDENISADEVAGWAETISYEIFTSISPRVTRLHNH